MDSCLEHYRIVEALGRIESQLTDGKNTMENLQTTLDLHCGEIRELKRDINNGLKSDIAHMKEVLKSLEGFNWFREAVQKMRDRLFWNMFKAVSLILIALVLFHLTDAATMEAVKGILSLLK